MTFPAEAHKESMLYGRYVTRTSVTFATGTTGTIAQHDLFTVSGQVHVVILAYCSTLLEGATATISVGTDDVVAGLQGVATAEDIDAGEIWAFDDGPSDCENQTSVGGAWVADDITYDVLVATIDAGVLNWTCWWTPVSPDATVVAA